MVKDTGYCLLLIAVLLPSITPVCSQSSSKLSESPFAESRLWNAEDIESYYRYLVSRQTDSAPDRRMSLEAARKLDALGYVATSGNQAAGAVYGWFTALFPTRGDTDAEIMRRVAYGILKNWPASERMMRRILYNYNPVSKQMIFGAPLLKHTWTQWVSLRRRLYEQIEGLSTGGAVEHHYEKWKEYWGPDPDPSLPAPISDGYLPEEFDGYWYLSIQLESEFITYFTVLKKKGHIFENWTGSNTEVAGHFVNRSEEPYGPYPVEICFNIPFDGDTIYFTDDYLKIPRKFRWFEPKIWYPVEPRRYSGPSGRSPHVAFDFEYPLMVNTKHQIEYAKAVLASSPGEHFMEVFEKIRELKSRGLEIGIELRRRAGPYQPSDGGKPGTP